jgi:hypothetical protein
MTMSPHERAEFVNAYTRVLITTWSDDAFAARLDANPAAALRECGLDVPADAAVEVVRAMAEGEQESSLDVQIEAWELGAQTRRYSLYVPGTPQVDTAELTDADLDSIAAGLFACCCCCPCCCCT